METKKFYWIKLKTNFFDLDAIDWLLSQKNGSDYVVLYLKLCLMTANSCGKMVTAIGEMIVPYDADKISRDTKMSLDTVVVAVELFKKIGLIYEENDGSLVIPYVQEYVGSESASRGATKQKAYRQRLKANTEKADLLDTSEGVRIQSVTKNGNTDGNADGNEMSDRDKSIEYRDKSLDIRDNINNSISIESESKLNEIEFNVSDRAREKENLFTVGEYKNVKLTAEQVKKLKFKYGSVLVREYIERLSRYMQSKGANFADHEATISSWIDADRKKGKIPSGKEHSFDVSEYKKLANNFGSDSTEGKITYLDWIRGRSDDTDNSYGVYVREVLQTESEAVQ